MKRIYTQPKFIRRYLDAAIVVTLAGTLAGCGSNARLAVSQGMGANPVLPKPDGAFIPTVNVAKAKPWLGTDKPIAATGTQVLAFAEGAANVTRAKPAASVKASVFRVRSSPIGSWLNRHAKNANPLSSLCKSGCAQLICNNRHFFEQPFRIVDTRRLCP